MPKICENKNIQTELHQPVNSTHVILVMNKQSSVWADEAVLMNSEMFWLSNPFNSQVILINNLEFLVTNWRKKLLIHESQVATMIIQI